MAAAINGISRSILILYGSETGNAQDIAEELGRLCQRLHFETHVDPLDAIDLNSLLRHQLVIFVISTTGQGDMPHNSLLFWKKLLRKRLPPGCLGQLNFTCFGLGDSTYIKFNWAARKLVRRLEQLGAQPFYDCFEADERFNEGIEGAFTVWAQSLYTHLLEQYPAPHRQAPIPEDALLPPRWSLGPALDKALQDAQSSTSNINGDHVNGDVTPLMGIPSSRPLPVPNGLDATLVEMKRLTPTTHGQDVRLVTFEIPHTDPSERPLCNPGDCLTIYPKNVPSEVQRLITLMGWEHLADLPLDLSLCGGGNALPRGLYYSSDPGAASITTVRTLLLENVDISATPRRSFLRSMAHFTDNPDHKDRLLEFTHAEFLDEYFDYATRSRRTILEVLEEFASVQFPADRLLDVFPLIHGRDFSIANGGNTQFPPSSSVGEGSSQTTTTRVELLVALVRYRTILRKPREGLCSRYLSSLPPSATIRVTHKPVLSPIHGPVNSRRPLVAIATGTGLAPIRSLIHERLTHPERGPVLLFFGNRNRAADFFFHDEWERLAAVAAGTADDQGQGQLRVLTAFSRDQAHKVYVQHVLRQQSGELADLIARDAIFAICGGSSKMADACKEAVFEPFKEAGEDKEERERVLNSLTWWQEIWS